MASLSGRVTFIWSSMSQTRGPLTLVLRLPVPVTMTYARLRTNLVKIQTFPLIMRNQ